MFFDPPVIGLNNESVIPGAFGDTKITLYSPEKIELTVNVPGEKSAALVSTERWGKSWLAKVDGVIEPVYTANLLFRGLILKPGHHQVEWTYEPPYWKRLAFFSELTLLLSLVLGIFFIRRKNIKS